MSLSSCGYSLKKTLEKAQAAYSNEEYKEVISLLENYKDDQSAKELYESAEVELFIKKAQKAFDKGEYEEVFTTLEGVMEDNEDAKKLYDEAQYESFEVNIRNITRLSKDTQISELLLDLEATYQKNNNKRIALEDKLLDVMESYFEEEPTFEDFKIWESVAANLKFCTR